jgi:hypothetical protein
MDYDDSPCDPGSWSFYGRVAAPPLRDWIAARVPEAIAPPLPQPEPSPQPAAPGAAAAAPAPAPAARTGRRRAASRRAAIRRARCLRKAPRFKGGKRRAAVRRCRRVHPQKLRG